MCNLKEDGDWNGLTFDASEAALSSSGWVKPSQWNSKSPGCKGYSDKWEWHLGSELSSASSEMHQSAENGYVKQAAGDGRKQDNLYNFASASDLEGDLLSSS